MPIVEPDSQTHPLAHALGTAAVLLRYQIEPQTALERNSAAWLGSALAVQIELDQSFAQ
jgi:hypothetical protein